MTGDVGLRWEAAMRADDWEAAWRETDRIEIPRRREESSAGFRRQSHHLVWDGSDFRGRSVLVRCEHGLGDTLQFSRFLPWLHAQALELHVMAQPPLVELLRGLPGFGTVHDGWRSPDWPAHEVEIEVMELAYAARATADTVSPPSAQLRSRAAPLVLPRRTDGRLRGALLWAASEWDPSRSVALAALQPLVEQEEVRWNSLQQGPAADDPRLRNLPIHPLHRETGTVTGAAAALCQMDLVVCVDGMPAHLAASLGCRTWLLLKHDADWRWGSHPARTPWYPSMRLFRQPAPGDWSGAIGAAAQALQALVAQATEAAA